LKLLNLLEQMTTAVGGATMQTGAGEQFAGKRAFKKKATLKEKKPNKKPIQTMNLQELYNQVIADQINKDTFLQNVRRHPSCKSFITNVSSYEDTIQQLKSKGYIYEAPATLNEDFNLNASIQQFTEAAKKKVTRDDINDYEFQKGWRYEFEKMKTPDVKKAQEKALKHLASDDIYYTRLITQEKKTGRTDQMIPVKKDNFVDKANEMKKAKKAKEYKADPKGKSEKVTGKPTGVKTMKGGDGEMKTIGEGVVKKKTKIKENSVDEFSPAMPKQYYSDTPFEEVDDCPHCGKKMQQKPNSSYGGYFCTNCNYYQKGLTKPKNAEIIRQRSVRETAPATNQNQSSVPDEKPVSADNVSFTIEGGDKKKFEEKKTVQSKAMDKHGNLLVTFTTKETMQISKRGEKIEGIFFGKGDKSGVVAINLDSNFKAIIKKEFAPKQEEPVDEEMKVDKKGNLNVKEPKIEYIGFSNISEEKGGGVMIYASVDGKKRRAKVDDEEDLKKLPRMTNDIAKALAKKYLVDTYDEKVDKLLASSDSERIKAKNAKNTSAGSFSANEAVRQLEESLRRFIREQIKASLA
jgi:hypothetical protein